MVRTLAAADISIELGSIAEDTPYLRAVELGFIEVAHLLISLGADTRQTGPLGDNAAHIAAVSGSCEMLKLVCESGANINAQNSNGMTPVAIAAKAKGLKKVLYLHSRGADGHKVEKTKKWSPLRWAAEDGDAMMYGCLLACFGVPNDLPTAPLFNAVVEGKLHVVSAAIANNEDLTRTNPADRNMTYMHAAALYNWGTIITALAREGADVNSQVAEMANTPLLYAAAYSNYEAMHSLLVARANPNLENSNGDTAVSLACRNGSLDLILLLTKGEGLDVDCCNTRDGTALHTCVTHGHLAIFKILLQNGANPGLVNRSLENVYAYASRLGKLEFTQHLSAWETEQTFMAVENPIPDFEAKIDLGDPEAPPADAPAPPAQGNVPPAPQAVPAPPAEWGPDDTPRSPSPPTSQQ
jgi:ankyrin repeat protein